MRDWILAQARRAFRSKHEDRRRSYRACFLGQDSKPSPDGEIVLADLRRFCRAVDTSFVPGDPYATAFNEGRREVWTRIQHHINLSDDTINLMVEAQFPMNDMPGGADDE